LNQTCVISFEGKILKIGVLEARRMRWWDVLLPQVGAILKLLSVQETADRYGQTDMVVEIKDHQDKWPPLAPEMDKEAFVLESQHKLEAWNNG
jgi:hypothetical protein